MSNLSYREILRQKFQEKSDKNPRYSLRAFAKFLRMSPSLLSEVLSGKKGISLTMAKEISGHLQLDAVEQNFFCDLVQAEHAKSPLVKEKAKERLKRLSKTKYKQLSAEFGARISDWEHFAILDAIALKDFEPSIGWVSRKFGIHEERIRMAVDRLVEIGLLVITPSGHWLNPHGHVMLQGTRAAISPHPAIFCRQLIEKAVSDHPKLSGDQRFTTAFLLTFNSKRMSEARKRIEEFRDAFLEEFEPKTTEDKDSLYSLCVQFSAVTTQEPKK